VQPGRQELSLLQPFEVFLETPGAALPASLQELYGGGFSMPSPSLYCNFVSSVDGVVAVEGVTSSGSLISGKSLADRFVMGLARATAEGVLMGAGTMRATPGHRWTAEHIYPDLADAFSELRRARGLAPEPRLVLVTGSGDIDPSHPGLSDGALVVTTTEGSRRLAGRLPAGTEVVVAGERGRVPIRAAVDAARASGLNVLLSEAGPHVNGQLLQEDLIDELLLTVSPVLAGRDGPGDLGMVMGARTLPGSSGALRLEGLRRNRDHLFLRYARIR
jgi:riboflavin biosynthesis pyrimidine reductase